jgi:periodic tryptophan protein 1
MLPNFPLCLEWLDFSPSSSSDTTSRANRSATSGFGNYIAVGTLDPEIEIWSLDVVDAIYPDAVLGRPDKTAAHVPVPAGSGKKKKKKFKRREETAEHHVDAVLALSWNRGQRNLLASASADRTVKLWDLSRCSSTTDGDGKNVTGGGAAIRSFTSIHKDKIQAIQWNPKECTILLTGSYDRTVRMFDTRTPDQGVGALLGSDVEALRWDPWEPHSFYVRVLTWVPAACILTNDILTVGSMGRSASRTGTSLLSTRVRCHPTTSLNLLRPRLLLQRTTVPSRLSMSIHTYEVAC